MNAAAEARALGALVNNTLAAVDELSQVVQYIGTRREELRARVCNEMPREKFDTDFSLQARVMRLHDALDRLMQPLSGFNMLKAGQAILDGDIEQTAAEIAALVKE